MREEHNASAAKRDDVTRSPVKMDAMPEIASSLENHRLMTKSQLAWRFVHPILWILLLVIGGPILIHELAVHYIDANISQTTIEGYDPSRPCDVQPIWTSWSTLFQINVRTGNLSFTKAKVIDVAFDLIVGRGGQVCLAWIAYGVYTDVLTRITENERVRYDLFAAIALQPNQITTLGNTLTSIATTKTFKAKCLLIWSLLTMGYVLAYPTLVSAATSLVGATTTAIGLPNNDTVPFQSYMNSAAYSLANTGLSDKPDPWVVSIVNITASKSGWCGIMSLLQQIHGGHSWSVSPSNNITVDQTQYTLSNDTQATCGFDFGGTFYPIHIPPNTAPFHAVRDQAICVSDGVHYQWGASWELLLVILVLQVTWALSMLLVSVEVTVHSTYIQRSRRMGIWRAILDLATPLMSKMGPSAGMYSEKELANTVRNMPPVRYETMVEKMPQAESYLQDIRLVSGSDVAVIPNQPRLRLSNDR